MYKSEQYSKRPEYSFRFSGIEVTESCKRPRRFFKLHTSPQEPTLLVTEPFHFFSGKIDKRVTANLSFNL